MTKFSHRFYNLYRHIIDVLIHADLDFKYTDFTNFYICIQISNIFSKKKVIIEKWIKLHLSVNFKLRKETLNL